MDILWYLIWLCFVAYITFNHTLANTNSCLEAQSFLESSQLMGYTFEDFDQPAVTRLQVLFFLHTCGLVHMDNLPTYGMCEKACSVHGPCAAYRFFEGVGCELCVFEIEREDISSNIGVASMMIGMENFRSYVEGLDECASNPCQHWGTCINLMNAYECLCYPGLTGDYCETGIAVAHDDELIVLNEVPLTFSNAQATCETSGGHLVEICDAELNNKLKEVVADVNADIWIGATDHVVENVFEWLTGSCEFSAFNAFGVGQPGNSVTENCLLMLGADGGLWHDAPCDWTKMSFCAHVIQ